MASSTLLVIITVVTGRSPLGAELRQVLLQRFARQGIERAERLVEKEHVRLDGERSRDRDALAHAARELARLAIERGAETDQLEARGAACWSCGARAPGNAACTASRTFSSAVNHGSSE